MNVRTLRAILADVEQRCTARMGGSTALVVRTIVTNEGEYATIAVFRVAVAGGVDLECHVAVIAADGVAIELEGCCRTVGDRAFARAFDSLVARSVTGSDPCRRRMFVYRPPPNWPGVRRALSTLWLAPGHPRDPASIEVHDAIPIGGSGGELVHTFLRCSGHRDESAIAVGDLLRGTTGASGAVLTDPRFRYEVDIDDPGGAHGAVLSALVRSIEPVPAPTRTVDVSTIDCFGWAL